MIDTKEGLMELEAGNRYEDFASDVLYDMGLPMKTYSSFKWQIEKGESRARVEIKNDKRFNETGNLYFETHEKKADATEWVESGLLRKDNTMFVFIGDYLRAWLFAKKQLLVLIKSDKFKKVETKTSKGVLIPIKYIEQHPSIALESFNFFEKNMKHIPGI